MSSFLDRFNLNPQERRWVVGALAAVFVVVNLMFVWPHFKDLAQVREALQKSRATLESHQKEADQLLLLKARFAKLEGASVVVPSAEQSLQLDRTIRSQARLSGVSITDARQSVNRPSGNKTNDFFEEQIVTLVINSGDKELVDFLVNLGSGDSVIRVRELTLKPDPTQMRLVGSLTLVASYQKESAAKAKPAVTANK